jgi:hypothetical protein
LSRPLWRDDSRRRLVVHGINDILVNYNQTVRTYTQLEPPKGLGSPELVIRTGQIGNGVCDSAHSCQVIVNDASLTDPEATVRVPITLAD